MAAAGRQSRPCDDPCLARRHADPDLERQHRPGQQHVRGENSPRETLFGGGVSYEAGRVYATNGAGDVAALDAVTGARAWIVKPGGPLRGAPTIAGDNVYVLSQDNQLFALNAAS